MNTHGDNLARCFLESNHHQMIGTAIGNCCDGDSVTCRCVGEAPFSLADDALRQISSNMPYDEAIFQVIAVANRLTESFHSASVFSIGLVRLLSSLLVDGERVRAVIRWRSSFRVRHRPSTCASAVSAWGSQNVMSMARYRSMAAVSAARACGPASDRGVQLPEAKMAVGHRADACRVRRPG